MLISRSDLGVIYNWNNVFHQIGRLTGGRAYNWDFTVDIYTCNFNLHSLSRK